jgi:hypothetical protein
MINRGFGIPKLSAMHHSIQMKKDREMLLALKQENERRFQESMENRDDMEPPYEYRKMIYEGYKIKRR